MKRKLCLYALIVTLALSSTAYAQEETENVSQKENLYYTYTSTLKPTANENELITVKQVTDKVKKYSASLKTSANEIDLLKNKSEGYGEQYVYSYSFSSLSNLLNSQASYKNAQISLESQNAEIEYSVLQSYVQIINSQREIQLSEKSLENAKYNLDLSKKKYELGVLAKETYENQELEYDNLKLSHQTKIDNLETEYEALNVLMGVDLDTRYSFELPAYYEKLELPISIDTYVTANSAKANSIKIKESNVSAAQNDKNVGPLNEGAIDLYNYQTLDNKLASAELELRDQKDTVSTNMKNLYNTIKQSETTIDSQIKELENLKKSLETATNKYELGVIAKADLISYEYAITQQESNILTAIYTHMLNVEKLTTPTLF